jgi:ribosomal protein S18 acetylase RimI-like enzyme
VGNDHPNGGVEIRRGSTADAAAIRELTRQAYAKWVPIIGREPLPMAIDYEQALRRNSFDLLYCEGELAALIETIAHSDHLLIENVAVSPAFQGHGFGRKLIIHVEGLARAAALDEVRLYTNKLFADNLRLYRGLGYRVDREEPFRGGFTVYFNKSLRP